MKARLSRVRRRAVVVLGVVVVALSVGVGAVALSAPPAGSGGEEEAGNNLSFPVIWAEGARLTLPGTFGDPQLINPYDGYTAQDVYLQAT
ncbi:MAG: hypothetical protein ACLGI5_16540, partial [Thermoleophilia bacterium]